MGKVRANNALTVVQGKVGNLSFAHYRDGRIIVRKTPEARTHFTPGQLAQQQRLARATLFVRALKLNAAAYAIYKNAALIRRKRACDLAMSDYLCAPVIRDIDLTAYTGSAGESIAIEAFDSFLVQAVFVAIAQADGTVLEEGQAVLDERTARWCYSVQENARRPQTLTVTATASDPAGNQVVQTVHCVLEGGA